MQLSFNGAAFESMSQDESIKLCEVEFLESTASKQVFTTSRGALAGDLTEDCLVAIKKSNSAAAGVRVVDVYRTQVYHSLFDIVADQDLGFWAESDLFHREAQTHIAHMAALSATHDLSAIYHAASDEVIQKNFLLLQCKYLKNDTGCIHKLGYQNLNPNFNLLYKNNMSDQDIRHVIAMYGGMLRGGDYVDIERILLLMELTKCSIEAIVVSVRANFPAREKLGCWPEFMRRCVKELRSRGREPARLLRGCVAA